MLGERVGQDDRPELQLEIAQQVMGVAAVVAGRTAEGDAIVEMVDQFPGEEAGPDVAVPLDRDAADWALPRGRSRKRAEGRGGTPCSAC